MTIDTTRVELRFSESETILGSAVVHCELPGIVVSVHAAYDLHAASSQDAWHTARREAQLEMVNWLRKLADIFEGDADRPPHACHPKMGGVCASGCNDPEPHAAPQHCSRVPPPVPCGTANARVLPLKRKGWHPPGGGL